MKKVEDMHLVQKKWLTPQIVQMTLKGGLVLQMNRPGQFVHLRVPDGSTLLRRPISIHAIDQEELIFDVIFRIEGKGTKLLSKLTVGDTLHVMGPLGNGFPVSVPQVQSGNTACLIGGGIGIPPLYELSKQLKQKGMQVIHILGFGSEKECILEDAFTKLGQTLISTVDGSKGTHGFVTDILKDKDIQADIYYSCGPVPMFSALEALNLPAPVYVSYEERMACGMGACYACVCKNKNQEGYKRICKEGPVFQAGEVEI